MLVINNFKKQTIQESKRRMITITVGYTIM